MTASPVTEPGATPMTRSSAPDETGSTIADAMRFLRKAKSVYVAVPRGFDDEWDYFFVSKVQAKKHLTFLANVTERRQTGAAPRIASRTKDFYGEISLYLGNVNDLSERA